MNDRQKKYKEIEEMIMWCEENFNAIAREDGMNIIMGIATNEKVIALGMAGRADIVALMTQIIVTEGAKAREEANGECETLN